MKDPNDDNVFICDNCGQKANRTHTATWDFETSGHYASYKIYITEDGRHYCGTCRRCRCCHTRLKPDEIYKPVPRVPISGGNNAQRHASLCETCWTAKRTFLRRYDLAISRTFTENTGKPLKNLLRLSTRDFKLQDFAELKHDDGRTIQVGWFYDNIHGSTHRISQFQKTVKFNSKGKEISNRFDRRGRMRVPGFGYDSTLEISLSNLMAFTSHAPSHCRHYIHRCRALGYRLTLVKTRGRVSFLNSYLKMTLSEERESHRRETIDRKLGRAIHDDHKEIKERYDERLSKIDWVEEYIPKSE